MDISVIIPSRGPTVGLWATISALEQQAKCEYVVAFHNEPDKAMQRLMHNCPERVKFVQCTSGPAQSRNVGVKASHGEILVFVDDHVIVPQFFLHEITYDLISYPGSIFHVPFQSFPDGPIWYEYGEDEKPYRDSPQQNTPYQVLSGSHGCFAMERSTWDILSGYDERFDRYGGEEVYFGLKAKKLGIKVMLDPSLVVMHYSPPVQDTPWKLDYFPQEKQLCDELR